MTQRQFERGLVVAVILMTVGFFAVQAQGQTLVLSPIPFLKSQFFNGSAPCNGCKLYSYSAGTTTPLLTYTDSTGLTPNANPVVLDSSGYGNVFLSTLASYKFVLKTSADVTIWTEDAISGACLITGCGMSGELFVAVGTGPAIAATATSGNAINSTTSASGGIAVNANASSSSGSTIGVSAAVTSATGTSVKATSFSGLAKIFDGVNSSLATSVFTVSGFGAVVSASTIQGTTITATTGLVVNGGTALTTTNQTGTGSLVLATSPTIATPAISAPAITGNMTYANTTPVANLTGQVLSYNIAGVLQPNSHAVVGVCTLGTDCAITLSNGAVYASSGSYFCWAQDTTAAAATKIAYSSGTVFTITGTGTDVIRYGCIGN